MPTGYGPDRLNAVKRRLPEFSLGRLGTSEGSDDVSFMRGTAPNQLRGPMQSGVDATRDMFADAVARSSIDLDVLDEVRNVGVDPTTEAYNGVWLPKDRTLMLGRNEGRLGRDKYDRSPDWQALGRGQTVIHELGHVSDPTLRPLLDKRNRSIDPRPAKSVEGYAEPRDLGATERFADDFSIENFRAHPDDPEELQFPSHELTYPSRKIAQPRELASYEGWGDRAWQALETISDRGPRLRQTATTKQNQALDVMRMSQERGDSREDTRSLLSKQFNW